MGKMPWHPRVGSFHPRNEAHPQEWCVCVCGLRAKKSIYVTMVSCSCSSRSNNTNSVAGRMVFRQCSFRVLSFSAVVVESKHHPTAVVATAMCEMSGRSTRILPAPQAPNMILPPHLHDGDDD